MVARMLPGFVFAPLGGALIDRWNRKVVMVTLRHRPGRAAGAAAVLGEHLGPRRPVVRRSRCSRCCGARPRTRRVPNIVKDPEQLASANSLGLVAAFGTFPLGAVMFAALAGIAHWLGAVPRAASPRRAAGVARRSGSTRGTFLVSALLISRLRLDEGERGSRRARSGVADVARHQGGARLHPRESAGARRDDRARGRLDRRRRDRAARPDRRDGGPARRSRPRSDC